MNSLIVRYQNILGVNDNASISDIKSAYRKKSKLLHPDVNKSIDAEEQFVELNEAYVYLYNLKSNKLKFKTSNKNYANVVNNWDNTERNFARERAKENARKRYQDYINSDDYKSSKAFENLLDFILFIISVPLALSPFILYFYNGFSGMVIGIIFMIFSSVIWVDVLIHKKHILSFSIFKETLKILVTNKQSLKIIYTIFNIIVFLYIALNTLINFKILLLIYVILAGLPYIFHKIKKNITIKIHTYSFINLFAIFLIVNYYFSDESYIEKYSFKHYREEYRDKYSRELRTQNTTFINLENDSYQSYPGIRIFININEMKYSDSIQYKFERGLMGLRVLKEYQFN